MVSWIDYRGMQVPDISTGDAGINLTANFEELARRAAKTNFAATNDPGAGDDLADGYYPGSLWLNTTTRIMWICLVNTATAAQWQAIGSVTDADLAAGHIWVGDSSDKAAAVELSGDAMIDDAGELTIADSAVSFAKIQDINSQRIMGRQATDAGPVTELTVTAGSGISLEWSSTDNLTISATGGGSGTIGSATIDASGLTSPRTFTLPDESMTLAGRNVDNTFASGQTIRVSDDIASLTFQGRYETTINSDIGDSEITYGTLNFTGGGSTAFPLSKIDVTSTSLDDSSNQTSNFKFYLRDCSSNPVEVARFTAGGDSTSGLSLFTSGDNSLTVPQPLVFDMNSSIMSTNYDPGQPIAIISSAGNYSSTSVSEFDNNPPYGDWQADSDTSLQPITLSTIISEFSSNEVTSGGGEYIGSFDSGVVASRLKMHTYFRTPDSMQTEGASIVVDAGRIDNGDTLANDGSITLRAAYTLCERVKGIEASRPNLGTLINEVEYATGEIGAIGFFSLSDDDDNGSPEYRAYAQFVCGSPEFGEGELEMQVMHDHSPMTVLSLNSNQLDVDVGRLRIKSNETTSPPPTLQLYCYGGGGGGGGMGSLEFHGSTSTSSIEKFADITALKADATNPTFDGRLLLNIASDGDMMTVADLQPSFINLNTDVRVNGILTANGNAVATENQIIPVTPSDTIYVRKSLGTCTISNASPAVVTNNSHGLSTSNVVFFHTTGSLPTPLVAGTKYYVKTIPNANTFQISATFGGPAIDTTTSGSGTHYLSAANPAGDGFSNTVNSAIPTLTSAVSLMEINYQLRRYPSSVIIQLADGVYSDDSAWVNGSWGIGVGFTGEQVYIVGNTATPSNVSITHLGGIIGATYGAKVKIAGMKLTSALSSAVISYGQGSSIVLGQGLEFGSVGNCHLYAADGGYITSSVTDVTISGGGKAHIAANNGGLVNLFYSNLALGSTSAFTEGFVSASNNSHITFDYSNLSGSATGPRYLASGGSTIYSTTALDSFPGNAPGTGKDFFLTGTKGSNIASASTTNLETATGLFVHVTGTTTITSLGDSSTAGHLRFVVFDGALTLSHNATSLILPTGANITTAAGDAACFVTEGSNNWRCLWYSRTNGTALAGGGGSGLSDGDKGDVSVSGSGSVWTIDSDAVTYPKMQNVSATDKVLGRSSAGAGDVEEIDCTAAGRAMIAAANATAQASLLLPSGLVLPYAGSSGSAPSGWLFCYGQAVSRTTYSSLYSAIGTTYGTGDGSTTFNVPDMRGRVAAGRDDMGGSAANRITNSGTGNPGINGATLGAAGGSQSHTLTIAELAAHGHSISGTFYQSPSTVNGSAVGGGTGASGVYMSSISASNTGSGDAHAVVQPTIILNHIIKI